MNGKAGKDGKAGKTLLKVHVVPWTVQETETLSFKILNQEKRIKDLKTGSLKVQKSKEMLPEKLLNKFKWRKLWVLVVSKNLEINILIDNQRKKELKASKRKRLTLQK